ncbi:hypothetical protein FS837_005066, partial [Tulasnella sp. UAMH 9824]
MAALDLLRAPSHRCPVYDAPNSLFIIQICIYEARQMPTSCTYGSSLVKDVAPYGMNLSPQQELETLLKEWGRRL